MSRGGAQCTSTPLADFLLNNLTATKIQNLDGHSLRTLAKFMRSLPES